MKKNTLFMMFSLCLIFFIVSVSLFAKGDLNYGHISYVDKGATVVRADGDRHKAVINLPVVAGDEIVTQNDGRCELQFDNGTVLRLDKNSRLKITTILAPTLTSRWKVTTLHLMEGRMYSMNQSYNQEMFQVITPNAAIDLKKRGATTISLTDEGGTFVRSDKGSPRLLLGEDKDSLEVKHLKKGQSYLVTRDNKLIPSDDLRDVEFVGYNKYVNRNFKDTHYGVSKVPDKIYRYSKGLVHWAEKWSTLYGEWVYDDLLGYVWKPADEIFAISKRPFFHASYVKINGKTFVVPQQSWGWAPSHMGTWVWMKWGWTWVPGDAFGFGVTTFNRLDYWVNHIFGSYSLYYTYLDYGYRRWSYDYARKYNYIPKRPSLKSAPIGVRKIIRKMNKVSVSSLKNRFGNHHPSSVIVKNGRADFMKTGKLLIQKGAKRTVPVRSTIKGKGRFYKSSGSTINRSRISGRSKASLSRRSVDKSQLYKRGFRDFNPDVNWGRLNGIKVRYSSKTNSMVAPKLKLNSRSSLGRSFRFRRGFNYKGRYIGTRTTGTGTTTSTTTTTSSSVSSTKSSASGSRQRSSGSKGSRTKK